MLQKLPGSTVPFLGSLHKLLKRGFPPDWGKTSRVVGGLALRVPLHPRLMILLSEGFFRKP